MYLIGYFNGNYVLLCGFFFYLKIRYQVGATILGGEVALKYGWSICLSGGMHHASSDQGGGWCIYSDIPISIKSLYTQKKIKTAMIIDLDAHQGNGHERDKLSGIITDDIDDVYIIDFYNKYGYPGDNYAKKGIIKKNLKKKVIKF
jgi:histone deacetylase 11